MARGGGEALEELRMNSIWLEPLLDLSAHRIPSSYFLADVLLEVDEALDGGLLRQACKQTQALDEALALRMAWSYLRQLWRCSPECSTDGVIQSMKAKLQVKPASSESLGSPSVLDEAGGGGGGGRDDPDLHPPMGCTIPRTASHPLPFDR